MTKTSTTLRKHCWRFMKKATEEKYSFLFVNLMESDINDVFKIKFEKKILVDYKI